MNSTREYYEKSTMGMNVVEKLQWVNNRIDGIEMSYDTIMDSIRDKYCEYRNIRVELEREVEKNGTINNKTISKTI